MKCPSCGNEKTGVTRTVGKTIEGDLALVRTRKCAKCKHKFETYETYEMGSIEAPFDLGEARKAMERAAEWLKAPAQHIPLVRDARRELLRHTGTS